MTVMRSQLHLGDDQVFGALVDSETTTAASTRRGCPRSERRMRTRCPNCLGCFRQVYRHTVRLRFQQSWGVGRFSSSLPVAALAIRRRGSFGAEGLASRSIVPSSLANQGSASRYSVVIRRVLSPLRILGS